MKFASNPGQTENPQEAGANIDLSFIITSRNDDHGDQPLKRLQAMIDNLAYHAKRLKARWEIVLVEWNPPVDRPGLAEMLTLPGPKNPLSIRFEIVPAEIHYALPNSDKLPLFQMIAKNAGAKVALGKFFLFTNIDILLSRPMADFLAQIPAEKGVYYRADRLDVDRDVPVDEGAEVVLSWAKLHQIRHNGLVGTYPVAGDGLRIEPQIVRVDGVRLGKNFTMLLGTTPQILSSTQSFIEVDAEVLAKGISLEVGPGPGAGDAPAELQMEIVCGKEVERKGKVTVFERTKIFIKYTPSRKTAVLRFSASGSIPSRINPLILPWALFAISSEVGPLDSWLQSETMPLNETRDVMEGIVFRGDWHPVEISPSGSPFRWGARKSQLEVPFPPGCKGGWLWLDLGPGPGTGMLPWWVDIEDDSFGRVERFVIPGRRQVRVFIPRRDRDWARITLHPDPVGYRETQSEADGRILNFAFLGGLWTPTKQSAWFPKLRYWRSFFQPENFAKFLRAWSQGHLDRKSKAIDAPPMPKPVHMNNCGDFTLVSRDDFFRVGGHSEEPVFSLNLDTEFLYRLVQVGLREQILDPQKEIYHIEHGTGTGATPEGMKLLLERLKSKGIPVISLEEVFARAIKMK